MKKVILALFVMAAPLAIFPAVLAGQSTTFNWSASSNGLVGSGTITATPDGSVAGAWDITGMTGTFSNSNTSLGDQTFSGTVVGLTGYLGEAATLSYNINAPMEDASTDYYDDLLYLNYSSPASSVDPPAPAGLGGGQFDNGGLVFNVDTTGGVYEIQLEQYGSSDMTSSS